MAAEFRASFDELARQSELDELRREVEALRNSRFGEPIAADLNASLSEFHDTVRSATEQFTPSPPSVGPGIAPQEGPVAYAPAATPEPPPLTELAPPVIDVPEAAVIEPPAPTTGSETEVKA